MHCSAGPSVKSEPRGVLPSYRASHSASPIPKEGIEVVHPGLPQGFMVRPQWQADWDDEDEVPGLVESVAVESHVAALVCAMCQCRSSSPYLLTAAVDPRSSPYMVCSVCSAGGLRVAITWVVGIGRSRTWRRAVGYLRGCRCD